MVEGAAKRWMALNSELESRRQEEVRQRSRVLALRREHTECLQRLETEHTTFKNKVQSLCSQVESDSSNADTSGECCALLLEELESVQAEKQWLEQAARAAEERYKKAQAECEEEEQRANMATHLHADAEEIADKARDVVHAAAAARAEDLRLANEALRQRLQQIASPGPSQQPLPLQALS